MPTTPSRSREAIRTVAATLGAAALLASVPGSVPSSPAGSTSVDIAPGAAATGAWTSASTPTASLNTSASGTGILVQEFSVPDSDSQLDLDIEITDQDLDDDEHAFLRATDDSDVAHHLLATITKDGVVTAATVASGRGDVGGVYARTGPGELGAGLDGGSWTRSTSFHSTSSQGADMKIAVVFVRSIVDVKTEIEWTGNTGTVGETTHGEDSVVSLDVDDFQSGSGLKARPGPSVAVDATSTFHADHMVGFFDPTQGPGYAEYSFDGPGQAPKADTVTGSAHQEFLLHRAEPGPWRFDLQAAYTRDNPFPVLLAGDLEGGIDASG